MRLTFSFIIFLSNFFQSRFKPSELILIYLPPPLEGAVVKVSFPSLESEAAALQAAWSSAPSLYSQETTYKIKPAVAMVTDELA